MAWIFSMAIEAGTPKQAEAIHAYFKPITHFGCNGKRYVFNVSIHPNGTAVGFTTEGVSTSGVYSPEVANELSAIGRVWYKLLKQSPDFQFALVGIEVEEWRTMEEFAEEPEIIQEMSGLVVCNDLYQAGGAPKDYSAFRKGYWWRMYEGESYEQ